MAAGRDGGSCEHGQPRFPHGQPRRQPRARLLQKAQGRRPPVPVGASRRASGGTGLARARGARHGQACVRGHVDELPARRQVPVQVRHPPNRGVLLRAAHPLHDPRQLRHNGVGLAARFAGDVEGARDRAVRAGHANFTAELATKVLAYGLLFTRQPYLRDPWCKLDFVVDADTIPVARQHSGLRTFRALPPLRALRRVPGLAMLVQWILD